MSIERDKGRGCPVIFIDARDVADHVIPYPNYDDDDYYYYYYYYYL